MQTNGSSSMLASATRPQAAWRPDKDWYHQVLYKIHLDLHTPDWHPSILQDLDPRQIVATVVRSGARALYFFSKCSYGHTYYNTTVGQKHKCLGERDLLAEMVEECHRQGLYIVAYYSVIWDNLAASRPEWCMRGPTGKPLSDTTTMDVGRWNYVCHNSGYADYAVEQLREVARGYDVDGFHLDMLNLEFGGLSCYCDHCRHLFREQYGKDLPTGQNWDETWRQFLEFRYASVERLGFAMRAAIHEFKPDTMIVTNYHGSPNIDWRVGQKPYRHTLYSDMNTGETYTPMLGDLYPGLETRFVRDLDEQKPFEMVSWRMNRATDYTLKPEAQLRWELFTSLAGGAKVMLIDQTFASGHLDEVPYERLAHVFKEIETKKPYFGGSPLRHVGLYYSCKNRDHYGRFDQKKFLVPVIGAYKALTESHFNVGLLFDETLTDESIAKFPAVYLPNVAAMTAQEVAIFTRYVERGGVLMATYDTSLYSEIGDKLDNFQLAHLFGVDYQETIDCLEHYLRNLGDGFGEGIHPDYYILNQGAVHRVRPTTAHPHGDLHNSFFKRRVPDHFFSHNMHPPYLRETDALYVNRFGEGMVIYLPHTVDGSYADKYELPEHRLLLRNIVRFAAPEPLVRLEAPLNVETIMNQKDGRLLVHLLAFNPIRQSAAMPSLNTPIRPSIRMEEPMLYRATLHLDRPAKSVRALDPTTRLEVDGSQVRLTCEQVHEVVIIEWA